MNPYGDDMIVDQVIGSAYQVVKYVASNMETLIELSDFIQFVSKEGLLELIEAVPELIELHAHLTELLAIHTNLTELLALEVNLPMLTVIYNMLPELQEIYDNLPAILDSSLSVAASREAIVRSYSEAGYPMDKTESFEVGGTISTAKETLLYEQNGVGYSWGGALPKSIPAGSTPSTTGGIGPTAWIDQSTKLLRQQLTAMSGNLNPAANWSDIPMYSDPELGGPDGPLNTQAEALAARSELLREALYDLGVVRNSKFSLRDVVSLADFIPASSDMNYLADVEFATALQYARDHGITNILLPSNMVFKISKTSLNKNVSQYLRIYCDRPAVYDENAGGTIWTDSDRVFDVGIDDGNPDITGFTRSICLENIQMGRAYDTGNADADTSDVAVNVVNTAHFKMKGCRTFGFKNGGVRPDGGNVIVDIDDIESYGLTGKGTATGYGYVIAKPRKYWGNFVLRIRNPHGFQYRGLIAVGKGRDIIVENPVAENMQDNMFSFSGSDQIYSLSISHGYGELIPAAFFKDDGFTGVIYNLSVDGLEAHEAGAGGYSPVLSTLPRTRVLHSTIKGIVCLDAVLDAQLGTNTPGRLVDTRMYPTGTIAEGYIYDDDLFNTYAALKNTDLLGIAGNFAALDTAGTSPYGWTLVNGAWAITAAPVQSGGSLKCTGGGNYNKISLDPAKPTERTSYAAAITHNGPIAFKINGTVIFSTTASGWKTDIFNFVIDTTAATFQIVIGPVTNAGDAIELAEIKLWKIGSADRTEVGWTSGLMQKAIRMAMSDIV